MARPTQAERERKRIADLLAEGKDKDGNLIEEGKILSEEKNESSSLENKEGEYSIEELEKKVDDSILGVKDAENTSKIADENSETYIPPDDLNPLEERVIENDSDLSRARRATPNNKGGNSNGTPPPPKDFAEPIVDGVSDSFGDAAKEKEKKEQAKPLDPEFEKLNATEKRQQVELFADALLTTYANIIPALPKMVVQFDMDKMELLDKDGIIRLSMTVVRHEDGEEISVRDSLREFNNLAEEVFVVTDDMKKELREPLIQVLMMKGVAPSPMTTLLIIAGQQLLMMTFAMFKMRSQANNMIQTFTVLKREETESEKDKHKTSQFKGEKPREEYNRSGANGQQPREERVQMDDYLNNADNGASTASDTAHSDITDAKIVSETKESNKKGGVAKGGVSVTIEDVVE